MTPTPSLAKPVPYSAEGIADTATASGVTAIGIDLTSDTVFTPVAAVYNTVTISYTDTNAITHEPVAHTAPVVVEPVDNTGAVVADTATASGVTAVGIDLTSDTVFIFGMAVYHTVINIFTATDVIAHEPVAQTAAVIADTETTFGVSANDIDIPSTSIFIVGATVYDTFTVILSGTDAIDHAPFAHTAACVVYTATAFSARDVDIDLASDTFFMFGVAVYDTITAIFYGIDAIDHAPSAHTAAPVVYTATAFSASAVDLDVVSDTLFMFGAAMYDTVTAIFAATDATAHEPVGHA